MDDPDFIPDGASDLSEPQGKIPPITHAPMEVQQGGIKPQAYASGDPDFIPDEAAISNEDKYGTPGQTAIGIAEKAAQGVIGPLAPLAEVSTGLTTPEAIRHRGEELGGLGTVSEMVGFGAGMFTPIGEAKLVGALGKGALELAGLGKAATLAAKELPILSRVGIGAAKGVVQGATEMAAIQGGEELTKLITKDPTQSAATAAMNVGMSMVFGSAFMGGFGSISPLWEATGAPVAEKILGKIKADWGLGNQLEADEHIVNPVLKNILSTVGGVSKEDIEKYAANREAIQSAPEFNDVYSNVLDHLTDIAENLEVKKSNVAGLKSDFETFFKEQKLALKQAGYDAGAADTLANEALNQAQTRLAAGVQQEAINAAPQVFSAVQKLRTNALEMSKGSMEMLDQIPGELSLKPVFEAIRPMQDKLYAQGFPALAEQLGKDMDVFAHQYGDKISYANAKLMIQGLQKRGTWTYGANEISNGLSPYFNQLSGMMNASLKEAVPAYEKAMRPTAEAFDLLGKLDKYGTPESSVKGVLGLKNAANYTNEMPILRSLEDKTGIKFTQSLENYSNPAIKDGMAKALPEYSRAQKTAEALERLKDPETRAALERAPYLSKKYQQLQSAEKLLEGQLERKTALSGLTPATLEGKLKSVALGKNLAARNVFEGIPGINDMTIPEVLDLIHTREAFEKGAMHGSRNVNLWAKVVGGLGGVISGILGHDIWGTLGGSALGAYIGATMDKEGPAVVRKIVDSYLDKYGDLPKAIGATPQATRAGLVHFLGKDVPPDAKAFKSTVNYINAISSGEKLLKGSVKALFQGVKVLPSHVIPDIEKTDKLDERSKEIQKNQKKIIDVGGGISKYMPEHGQALSTIAMRNANLINQFRPNAKKEAFFDIENEPTKAQKSEYNRGLQISQQPLMVLQHIQDNTITPGDVQVLKSTHPEFYDRLVKELSSGMISHAEKEGKISYQMRQGLSTLLGIDLDSSLKQANILLAQMSFINKSQPQGVTKAGMAKLKEAPNQYRTSQQAAESRQSSPKA